MENIKINSNYIKEDDITFLHKFMLFIYNKYELKNIECSYSNTYDGYVFKIKKNKIIYFFIYKKDFDVFITLEKFIDMNKNINCNNVLNNLHNNINSLLNKTYYFKNKNELEILKTKYKDKNKIINLSMIKILIE